MSDRLAALYLRVSTLDQHPETQLHDLRQMAAQRGLQVAGIYEDRITGARASRPGLDRLMRDARQGKFHVLVVWSCDRLARSVRHFLETLDELNRLGVEFLSFREQLDTGGPLGRAVVIIVGAIAELERSLIVERVRAGLRRAKLEGRRLGRPPMQVNREALWQDRQVDYGTGPGLPHQPLQRQQVARRDRRQRAPGGCTENPRATPSASR